MSTITIELLNDKAIHLLQDLELLNIIRISNNDIDVPDWHKDIVRERIKNAKPEDLVDWESLEKKLDEKYGV